MENIRERKLQIVLWGKKKKPKSVPREMRDFLSKLFETETDRCNDFKKKVNIKAYNTQYQNQGYLSQPAVCRCVSEHC